MLEARIETTTTTVVKKAGGKGSAPLERDIERNVSKYARAKGALAFKWISPNNAGVCDHIFIYFDRVWFVEFKRPGQRPTPLQEKHHKDMRAMGMRVYVVDSFEQGKEVIDRETH